MVTPLHPRRENGFTCEHADEAQVLYEYERRGEMGSIVVSLAFRFRDRVEADLCSEARARVGLPPLTKEQHGDVFHLTMEYARRVGQIAHSELKKAA